MQAIELTDDSHHRIRLTERPAPVPGRGEVLIRVRAAALNHRDLEIRDGRYGMAVQRPLVPLSDAVGDVVEVGATTAGFAPGDRVIPTFFPTWIDGAFRSEYFASQLGSSVDGVLRELMVYPATGLVHAPSHLGDEAAALPIAALTAWSALCDASLGPGQTLLVIGTGGVALFAVQFARLFGARAIVVSSSDHKLARAMELGAAHGVNYQRVPHWGAPVRDWSGGAGVDVVLELGGAATLPQSTVALRVGGTIAIVGYLTGPQLQLDLRELFIGKRARLRGQTVGSRRDFEAMNRALEWHRVVPVIDSRFALSDTPAAYERMASGQALGKVLIAL